jgi:glyoxylase-like metal-dependent hydrolase (beta-lactamase superfamily II)/rhodanese-related sulfurtransferase
MLIFRQLYDSQSSTYTYLLADADSKEAVLIDPVFEQVRRDASFVCELGLKLLCTLETHVHADHITGGWLMRQRVGSSIAISSKSGAEGADRFLNRGDRVAFGSRYLEVRETPGHTSGCLTFVLDDRSRAFTGDCLLVRGAGRTDFQGGSAHKMFRSIKEQIFSLPDACLLYPAHDYRGVTVTSVYEEKRFNPRIGGDISESDFAGFMDNLNLPHPKLMEAAVPANLKCGMPKEGLMPPKDPDWAPLSLSFGGIWEIQPQALEEHHGKLQIIDVREPTEFEGPLGHIKGASLLPLGQLAQRAAELSKDVPIVTVCRAGGRSAQATVLLQRAGFTNVANLAGGMLRWRAQHHPVEGAHD